MFVYLLTKKINIISSISKKILKLKSEGVSHKNISNVLGCAISTVSYHCRKNGIKTNPTSKEYIDKIQNYYDKGLKIDEIVKEINLSRTTIIKYIKNKNRFKKLSKKEKKENRVNSVINCRRRKKIKLVECFGGKCIICGYKKCYGALEFHHVFPEEKSFSISRMNFSFKKLKKEAKKCILTCANCHREMNDGIISEKKVIKIFNEIKNHK